MIGQHQIPHLERMVRWCDANVPTLRGSGMSNEDIARRFLSTINEEMPMIREETVLEYVEAIAT